MKKIICSEPSITDKLQKFFEDQKLSFELGNKMPADISVRKCELRKECNLKNLYVGGWINCETARIMAKKMEISLEQFGAMLNLLDIKVRRCSLGCFK